MKLHGGSYDFKGSNSGIDLFSFTGWIPEQIFFQEDGSSSSSSSTSAATSDGGGQRRRRPPVLDHRQPAERAWERLRSAFGFGDCLTTIATSGGLDEREAEALGLVPGHAYAVLDVRECLGKRFLLVKNPWARKSWKGPYSAQDRARWTPELCAALGYDPELARKADDGVFWIDWWVLAGYLCSGVSCLWTHHTYAFILHTYAHAHVHRTHAKQGPRAAVLQQPLPQLEPGPLPLPHLHARAVARGRRPAQRLVQLRPEPAVPARPGRGRGQRLGLGAPDAARHDRGGAGGGGLPDFARLQGGAGARHIPIGGPRLPGGLQVRAWVERESTDGLWVSHARGDNPNPPPTHTQTDSNNPHNLTRLDVDAGCQRYALVLSQYEKARDLAFTLSIYATRPFTLRPAPPLPPAVAQLEGVWDSQSAGGRLGQRTFMHNVRGVC